VKATGRRARRTLWAYDYAIVPPQAGELLDGIRTILEEEHAAAQRAARTWTGRLVCERQVTHILVVTDSPDQDREVNRHLEGQLRRAHAAFSLTLPLPSEL
jgi:hypothetical protein